MPNNLLVKQYQEDLSLYISQSSTVKCKTIQMLQHEDAEDTAVIICDEFDQMIKKHAIILKSTNSDTKLYGLAPVYHFKKKYLLSATYDTYDLTVLKQAFDVDGQNYHDCWSKEEVAQGHRKHPFNANTIVRSTEKELEECLIN